METKRKGTATANIVCVAILLVLDILRLFLPAPAAMGTVLRVIDIVLHAGAYLCAAMYVLRGCRKEDAALYQGFLALFALTALLSLVLGIMMLLGDRITWTTALMAVCHLVVYIGATVLACKKDLGESRTTVFALVILFVNIAAAVLIVAISYDFEVILSTIRNIPLAAIACVFVKAKYENKDTRGSK